MSTNPTNPSQRTQRRKRALRETKAIFQALFESSPDAVIVVDNDGRILRVNAQAEAMFGYSRDELLGQPVEALMPERFRDQHVLHLAAFSTAPRTRLMGAGLELFGRRKDGGEFPVDITLSPFEADGTSAVIAVIRDITERKYAEERVRLLTSLAVAAGEADDFLTILSTILREVCRITGWVVGETWFPSADGTVIECGPAWFSLTNGLEELHRAGERLKFAPGEGLPGRVWASKAPLWIEDVTSEPTFVRREIAERVGLKSAIGMPILAGDEVVAVLTFFSHELRPQDHLVVQTVSMVATQLKIVFQRKQVEDLVRRQRDELAARTRIIGAIMQTRDLDERLNVILDEAMILLGVEFGGIHLVQGDDIVLRVWRGISDEFRAHVLSFPLDQPPDWMRQAWVAHERLSETGRMPDFVKREGIQAGACVPLTVKGMWLGVLMLASRRYDAFAEYDVRVLQAMAEQLALAIDHAHHFREAEHRLGRLTVLREIDRAIIVHQSIATSCTLSLNACRRNWARKPLQSVCWTKTGCARSCS